MTLTTPAKIAILEALFESSQIIRRETLNARRKHRDIRRAAGESTRASDHDAIAAADADVRRLETAGIMNDAAVGEIERASIEDGDDGAVSVRVYGRSNFIRSLHR